MRRRISMNRLKNLRQRRKRRRRRKPMTDMRVTENFEQPRNFLFFYFFCLINSSVNKNQVITNFKKLICPLISAVDEKKIIMTSQTSWMHQAAIFII